MHPQAHQLDYSEYAVLLQPLARTLYEQMAMREWQNATETCKELTDAVHEILKIAIKEQYRNASFYG